MDKVLTVRLTQKQAELVQHALDDYDKNSDLRSLWRDGPFWPGSKTEFDLTPRPPNTVRLTNVQADDIMVALDNYHYPSTQKTRNAWRTKVHIRTMCYDAHGETFDITGEN